MPSNIQIVRSPDFLRVRSDGRADLEAGKKLLAGIAEAALRLDDYCLMVDMRDTSGQLSPDDQLELAGSLLRYGGTFLHKTAILCPRERFDHARFFSMLAGNHGFRRIRAFFDYEVAMEWLLDPTID
ncbi:hypothetical protein [uncultured Ramlibacter sp.]|uniref:hypothetical protein n=1 Tax=uncultured Ramlibacter sp. TaxID=260755 RepID=UPI00261A0866|nr:hypothetical protein [uncultured Ramlibacter sp.]